MTTTQFKRLAKSYGASIEIDRNIEKQCVEICVIAPDEKQWKNGECIHMMGIYYVYINGDKETVYKTLSQRMAEGLETLDIELNP